VKREAELISLGQASSLSSSAGSIEQLPDGVSIFDGSTMGIARGVSGSAEEGCSLLIRSSTKPPGPQGGMTFQTTRRSSRKSRTRSSGIVDNIHWNRVVRSRSP